MPVNPPSSHLTAGSLRAMIGRYAIRQCDLAARLGCSPQYVSRVLRRDLHDLPVSDARLRDVHAAIAAILLEREDSPHV